MNGHKVYLYNRTYANLEKALGQIQNNLQTLVSINQISEESIPVTMANIHGSSDLKESVATADFIIENVAEKEELKKAIFSQLDELCDSDAIFSSDTSTMNIYEFLKISHPERLIMLNETLYPDISLNPSYMQMYQKPGDKEVEAYLQKKIRQAEWIRQCIAGLKPLRLIDVAQKLNIHESTVSRAVHQKYLQCSFGTYPLSYFFLKNTGMKSRFRVLLEEKNTKFRFHEKKVQASIFQKV